MINLNEMIEQEIANGYGDANAQAKVCQDIVLKAIATSSLRHNVTIKGGVVMRSKTGNIRRATQDLDIVLMLHLMMRGQVCSLIQMSRCLLKNFAHCFVLEQSLLVTKTYLICIFLKNKIDKNKMKICLDSYIYKDINMREKNNKDIVKRVKIAFSNKTYLRRLRTTDKKWMDEELDEILDGLVEFIENLE